MDRPAEAHTKHARTHTHTHELSVIDINHRNGFVGSVASILQISIKSDDESEQEETVQELEREMETERNSSHFSFEIHDFPLGQIKDLSFSRCEIKQKMGNLLQKYWKEHFHLPYLWALYEPNMVHMALILCKAAETKFKATTHTHTQITSVNYILFLSVRHSKPI